MEMVMSSQSSNLYILLQALIYIYPVVENNPPSFPTPELTKISYICIYFLMFDIIRT